jgi:hypothetical protein
MYIFAIALCLCVAYFILTALFGYFFTNKIPKFSSQALISVLTIFVSSMFGYAIALSIPDLEFGNRFLHAYGGGFMAVLVCFLVVKDSKLHINKFQFVVFSLLIATALGVANEILEFFLQNFLNLVFMRNINDTWYDLMSNTVGMSIAAILFTPFIKRK